MKVETVLIYHTSYKIGVFLSPRQPQSKKFEKLSQVLVGTVMIYNAALLDFPQGVLGLISYITNMFIVYITRCFLIWN